jgi:hypothetical protein
MIVKKPLLFIVALTMLLAAAGVSLAQTESKPLVVGSFAGYDKLLADIGQIGKLGGNPNLGKQLEVMSLALPQGEGSKGPLGLDTKQPWGLVVHGIGRDAVSYAFLPVSDVKPLLTMAKTYTGQDFKAENGIYTIPTQRETVYATQKGKWLYVAETPERLAKVAAEPGALLGDLPKRYALAVRASVKSLPQEYREQALAALRAGAESGMQQLPSEDEEQYNMRRNMAKQGIQQLTRLVNDMDEVLLGWCVDATAKSTYLDLELTAQAGTKLAAQMAEVKPGKTSLAGLKLPGAAITAGTVGTMSDAEVAQLKGHLATARKSIAKELQKQNLADDELKLASQFLNDLLDVVEKNVEAKKTDIAMSLMLDPGAVTFVAGAAIADGAKLQKMFAQLVAEVDKNGQTAGLLKISAEKYQNVQLHVLSIPTPDPQLSKLVGDTLEAAVGTADDKVVLAFGRDAAKTLKKALDQLKASAGTEVQPLEIKLALKPIAKFVAEVADNPQAKLYVGMLGGMLAQAGDKDHVVVTAQPITNGVRLRLELEEGLLKTMGSASAMMGGMAGGGGM